MHRRSGLAVGDGDRFAVRRFLVGESELAGHELEMGEQVFHVNQADDVIDVAVAQRQAGEGAALHGAEHLADRLIERSGNRPRCAAP